MSRINNIDLYTYATKLHKRLSSISGLMESKKYNTDNIMYNESETFTDPIKVVFAQLDTVKVLDNDLDEDLNPVVVCESNASRSCGNWDQYADGYEEYLSYRSTLPMCLVDTDYPLMVKDLIYCPNVCFFRDEKFNILRKSLKTAVVALATVKRPDFSVVNDVEKVTSKLQSIFKIAVLHHHTSIIMNAFGCDKDDNDPIEVAKIIKCLIEEYKFKIKKITITFNAVVNDHNFLMFKKTINNCF